MKLFPRLWHLHARLFLSFGFGAAVALSLLALPWRVSTRVIVGWDAGVVLYIALIYLVMAHGSIAKIRRRAAINDEGAIALLVFTAAASLASLASVLAELGHSPNPYQILLGIATILLSWTFMHTMFALHYAHEGAFILCLRRACVTDRFKAAYDLRIPLAKSSSRLSRTDPGRRGEFDLTSRPIETRVLRSHIVRNTPPGTVIASAISTQLDHPRSALVYEAGYCTSC